jgi:anti-sigma-K factor RskA
MGDDEMTFGDLTDPAARQLDDPAVWAEVSPDLRARTLAAATAEHATGPRRLRSHRLLLAAAAVVLLGVAVAGGLALTRDTTPAGTQVALVGTENMPGASATAELRNEGAGVSVTLAVGAVPPAPDGSFYEVWLVGEAGKVSAGTFHRRGDQDTVKLWLGVEPDGYDAITVTRQPVAGGTTAEGVVVLRGDLPAATQTP